MNSIKRTVANLPQSLRVVICVALTIMIGLLDFFTGDYGMTVAYILPIYVSAKLLGRSACICFTLLCVLEFMGLALNTRQGHETFMDAIFFNAVLQSAELGITGYLIAQFTRKLCQSTQA